MEKSRRIFKRKIDSAPGKKLIESLHEQCDQDVLLDFFQSRVMWCGGYPLVHDYLVTYGAFDDLLGALNSENKLELLPAMIQLAETVPDQQFHAALFLLADMIPSDSIRMRPAGLSDAILRLRLRAEKLSFLPNLSCAWESLVTRQRYLKSPSDFLAAYSPKQLTIGDERWRQWFSFPLSNHRHRLFAEAILPMALIRRRIQDFGASPGERKLVFSTRIEASKYWVWRIPGTEGTAHLWKMVFLRQAKDGKLGFGTWDLYRQFHERDTPTDISRRLLKIEFYPTQLEMLE